MIKEYTNKKNIDEFIDFFSDEYIAYIKADEFYKFSEIVPLMKMEMRLRKKNNLKLNALN